MREPDHRLPIAEVILLLEAKAEVLRVAAGLLRSLRSRGERDVSAAIAGLLLHGRELAPAGA